MALNPLYHHYAMENPASVYDEEAMTALELAGRTTAKVNEAVQAFNKLETETNAHLAKQDKDIPVKVETAVQDHIDNGDFDSAISEYAGDLEGRLNNLLGKVTTGTTSMDAEVIDARLTAFGKTKANTGEAIRSQVTDVMNATHKQQVYLNSNGLQAEWSADSKKLLVWGFDLYLRLIKSNTINWGDILSSVGADYVTTNSKGTETVAIPTDYTLIYDSVASAKVQVIPRADFNPLTQISLIEMLAGRVVGGYLKWYVDAYFQKQTDNTLGKFDAVTAKRWKHQVYPDGNQIFVEKDSASTDLFIRWTGLYVRAPYLATTYMDDVLASVGEDYTGTNSSGEPAIKLPSSHTLVLDMYDSSQQYKVVSRDDVDYNTQIKLVEQVSGNVVGGVLMPFIQQMEVDKKINTIVSLLTENTQENKDLAMVVTDERTEDTLVFTWASDIHFHDGSSPHGAGNDVTPEWLLDMATVSDNVKADFLTVTGDVCHGWYNLADQKQSIYTLTNILQGGKTPVLITMGNHDDNSWNASGTTSDGVYKGVAGVLPKEKFHAYTLNRNDAGVVVDPANPYGGWYYKDYPGCKIRVIALNPCDIPYMEENGQLKYNGLHVFGFREAQLNWFANTALKFDETGWGVVVLIHSNPNITSGMVPINQASYQAIMTAFINKTAGRAEGVQTDFVSRVDYDFTANQSNEFLALFCGHTHKDQVFYHNGVAHVEIRNAYEQGGFDIVTLNRSTKTIKTRRYNNGERKTGLDRTINMEG